MNTLHSLLLAIIISLFTGGFIGWKAGSSEVGKLTAQIEVIQQAAKQAKENHEKEVVKLAEETSKIQTQASLDLARSQEELKNFESHMSTFSAKKNVEIRSLKKLVSKGESDTEKLKILVSFANSDTERAELLSKLSQLETELQAQKLRTLSLECLSIPVPIEYIENFNVLISGG
jgi:hypothetical protein